jgi:outer membrane immunogenic protein
MMNRSLSFALGVVFAAAGAMSAPVSAHAADMPRAAPVYKAQPAAQTYDWTGFYLGINGGYGFGRSSWSDPAAGANSGRFNTSGGTLGGQLGYNWQTGPAVLGLETDMNWINAKGSSSAGGVCLTDGAGQCQTKQSWLGTTRARVGYAFDRWLPYLTGGVAYGDIRADQANGSSSTTKTGWTAGGGVEYGIDRNWSAKLEYLHVDLGTATFMGAASGTPTLNVPITDDIVRAGLNYRW